MTDVIAPLLNFVGTALVAVLAGGLSYVAGKGMKKHECALNVQREKIAMCQRVYVDFLAEADRQILQSMDSKSDNAVSFYELTRKFSEIELIATDKVASAAKAICDRVIQSHATRSTVEKNFYQLKQAFIKEAKLEIAEHGK